MLQRLWSRTGCLTTVFSLVAALSSLIAQPLPQYSTRQRTQLESLRQTFEQRQTENYRQAVQLATRLGRPIDPINFGKGRVSVLHGIDDAGNLLYGTTSSVTQAGISARTSSLYAGGSLGVNLSGSSATVKDRLGYWEVGVPRATHIELNGRITQVDNAANTRGNDAEEHATHVAVPFGHAPDGVDDRPVHQTEVADLCRYLDGRDAVEQPVETVGGEALEP